ncbi:MAG: chorismate synthase [Halobacteriovoraceae bacterium]|nr:chorismate synthase [Halobacteriovoraceae bacterium]MCB9093621.1 chorismate synthase [Halobacteriovoraceae bacterium]
MYEIINGPIRMSTAGESHGLGYTVIIEGLPSQIKMSEEEIFMELKRRRPGKGVASSARVESDRPQVLAGLFEGQTTGAPVCVFVPNSDAKSQDYDNLKNTFRPGHSDYSYFTKYGVRDHRGGGRSSARETLTRMIGNAFFKKILEHQKINVQSFCTRIGDFQVTTANLFSMTPKDYENPFLFADNKQIVNLEKYLEELKEDGNSIGGQCTVIANIPAGLGGSFENSLKAKLAYSLYTIPAVYAVEFGSGTKASYLKGSQHNDPMSVKDSQVSFEQNNHGGILGGISTGAPLHITITVKAPSSISKSQKMLSESDVGGFKEVQKSISGRHDACLLPRFCPIAEAMVNFVLANEVLISRYSSLNNL